MTWNTIMGFISSFAILIPVLLILVLKLGSHRSFSALLIYFSSIFIYNLLTEGYIPADEKIIFYWGVSNNLLDVPLMLIFLTYFSPTKKFTMRMKILLLGFILFESIVILITGFNVKGLTIILGPGLIIVTAFCLQFFIKHAARAVEHRKATGKAFIAGSLLFVYGCYSILYIIFYIAKTDQVADTFLIYFIATTLSSILLSVGLLFEWNRIKKIRELKITRKELLDIYKDTKMAAQSRTAMLDFDKEAWN